MTLLARIRSIRQADAVRLLGLSQPYVSDLARCKRIPSVPMAARIADKLGCSDEELGASVRQWAQVEAQGTSGEAA